MGGGEREEGKKKKMKKCPRQLDFFFSQPPLPLTPCNHAMPSLPRIQGSKMIPFQQKEKKKTTPLTQGPHVSLKNSDMALLRSMKSTGFVT